MSRQSGVSFSYLLTVGVVSFTRYSLLPWCLWNLNQRKYDSWTKVVPAYGFLLGSLQSGHALGQLLISLNVTSSSLYSTAFFLLTSSYICLCFVDRYSLLLGIFFTLGFSGSLLSGVSINLDKSIANIAFVRKPTDAELNNTVQRSIICFAFSTLVSGYLYESNPAVHFPLYRIMILITTACLLMSFYFCCINRVIRRKFQSKNGSNSQGSGSVSQSKSANELGGQKPVANYSGEVPVNYLSWYKTLPKAQAAYGKYLQWRQDYDMEGIFTTPQPGFHDILKYYPHAIHGYSLDGCVVVYEQLGRGDPAKLVAAGVTVEALVRHFALRNELCFVRLLEPDLVNKVSQKYPGAIVPNLNPRPEVRRLTSVLDVGGISLFSVTSDVVAFLKQSGGIIDEYYPEQVARLLIVNAPSFFSAVWSLIANVLPASVQKKVDILKNVKDLEKYIHPSQRPKFYGGTSEVELGQSDEHKAFLQLAEDWNNPAIAAKTGGASTSSSSSNRGGAGGGKSGSKSSDKKESKEQQKGKGMMGWFKSKLSKGSATKEAFLGNKNSYKYNASNGVWELEFDENNTVQLDEDDDCDTVISFDGEQQKEGSGKKAPAGIAANTSMIMSSGGAASGAASSTTPVRSNSGSGGSGHHHSHKKLTAAQIEDHGLILAIQAAHVAKSYSSDNVSALNDYASLEAGGGGGAPSTESSGGGGGNATGAVHSQHESVAHGRVSSDIFMMVGSMHILCASLHVTMMVLMPVWLVSQVSSGGLSYRVRDLALVMSTTAMVVLQFHVLLSNRLEYCLKASPVRTLRIACGILVSMCVVLPVYLSITTYDIGLTPAGASSATVTTVAATSTLGAIEESILVHKDYHSHLLANVNHNLPSHSVITLCITSLLCAVMYCASHVCRKATNILFHLTLHSSFTSPTTMRCIVNQIIDIITPILCTVLYSAIYGMKLVYPMNSSFFLSFASCGFIFIYMCSILLTVNFRGDYGVMTDSPDSSILSGGSGSSGLSLSRSTSKDFSMGSQLRSRHPAGSSTSGLAWSNPNRGGSNNSNSEAAQDVFSIPLGDLNLLFSQIAYSYGSKLHNLRDDYKDL